MRSDFSLRKKNNRREIFKINFKSKIRTSQSGQSDRLLTFATRNKRADCAREIYYATMSQGPFSDHALSVRYPRWTGYARFTSRCTLSKMTQEGDGYNARTSGASPRE